MRKEVMKTYLEVAGLVVAEFRRRGAVRVLDSTVVRRRHQKVRVTPQNLLAALEIFVLRLQRRHEGLLAGSRQLGAPPMYSNEQTSLYFNNYYRKNVRRGVSFFFSRKDSQLEREARRHTPVGFALRALLFLVLEGLGLGGRRRVHLFFFLLKSTSERHRQRPHVIF